MKNLLIGLGLFLASCAATTATPAFISPLRTELAAAQATDGAAWATDVAAVLATRTAEVEAGISTPVPTLAPGCMAEVVDGEFQGIVCEAEGPFEQRTNWLLLGGDYRAHRDGTGFGNKTDVIVLVSVLETDPIQITVVQFPRNLYAPFSLGDTWLFSVWDELGWQGLHQYFFEVFGVTLQGIHYINMDSFEQIVDELEGIQVQVVPTGFRMMSGSEALAYLRQNENNWELGSYDAGHRVFRVLEGLWARGRGFFLENPIASTNVVYSKWGDLFETDLSNIEQLYWLFNLGWKVVQADNQWDWNLIQLEEPVIIRGDTPIIQNEQPMRGMIADLDLKEWIRCAMGVECNE